MLWKNIRQLKEGMHFFSSKKNQKGIPFSFQIIFDKTSFQKLCQKIDFSENQLNKEVTCEKEETFRKKLFFFTFLFMISLVFDSD